ncbi:uncharacterized protein TNCV_1667711 [Trichonephila clavipes]|nr:uncharacterized protein TNCV_1667711 [Trichonephila clavipes]
MYPGIENPGLRIRKASSQLVWAVLARNRSLGTVSLADKEWPLDPRPDAVALYSGWTPGKRRAWFLPHCLPCWTPWGVEVRQDEVEFAPMGLKMRCPGKGLVLPDISTLTAVSVERLANQRLHLARNEVLLDRHSTLNCLGVNAALVASRWGCGSLVVKVSDCGGHAMSSNPIPLKTRRVEKGCTLNLSRAQTSSRWCGVVVRRGGCHLRCRHLNMVQNDVVRRPKPSCS